MTYAKHPLIAAVVFLCLFVLLLANLDSAPVVWIDQQLGGWLYAYSPAWIGLARVFGILGQAPFSIVIATTLGFYHRGRGKAFWPGLPLLVFIAWGCTAAVKYCVHRPRPELIHLISASSPSFPSGHAMGACTLLAALAYLLRKSTPTHPHIITACALGLILIAGLSRLILGVHYASDILAGYLLSLFFLSLYIHMCTRVPV